MSEELVRIDADVTGEIAKTETDAPEPVFELQRPAVSYVLHHGDERERLIIGLRWPDPVAVRKVLDGQQMKFTDEGEMLTFDQREMAPFYRFLCDHMVSVRWQALRDKETGTYCDKDRQPSLDQVKALVMAHQNYGWAEVLILGGLFAVQVQPLAALNNEDFDSLFDDTIVTTIRHWREDLDRYEWVKLHHVLSEPTAKQAQAQKRAMKLGHHKSSPTFVQTYDALALTEIYRERIQRIDNLTIDGAPCDERTRSAWVGEKVHDCKIPYQWIHAVMWEDTQGRRAKGFQ